MKITIDILDTNGIKKGDGPLLAVTGWSHIARLSSAGEFSAAVAPTEERVANILHFDWLRAYAIIGEERKAIGTGIFHSSDMASPATGSPTLSLGGPDLLDELRYLTVGDLFLHDIAEVLPANVQEIVSGVSSTELLLAHDGNPATSDNVTLLFGPPLEYLYVGSPRPFNKITFDLSAFNGNAATLAAQYFNGSGWQPLAITDGTSTGGKTLAQDGAISWATPADETDVQHSDITQFWIRLYPSASLSLVGGGR